MRSAQTLRLPLRLIEARYGAGNFDDAGEDIRAWTMAASGEDAARAVEFDFDATHANPWFHVMICAVTGMSDEDFARLASRLVEEGLID